jgi:hypothetical protein
MWSGVEMQWGFGDFGTVVHLVGFLFIVAFPSSLLLFVTFFCQL